MEFAVSDRRCASAVRQFAGESAQVDVGQVGVHADPVVAFDCKACVVQCLSGPRVELGDMDPADSRMEVSVVQPAFTLGQARDCERGTVSRAASSTVVTTRLGRGRLPMTETSVRGYSANALVIGETPQSWGPRRGES
jgi:hypothetical protein